MDLEIGNGIELSPVERTGGWLFEVRIRGVVMGFIRQHPVSGTFRYHRIFENDAEPLHEGNDLKAVLKWVAHRP